MKTYALKADEGSVLYLNDGSISTIVRESTTLNNDNFAYDNKIVERSSLPGAVQLGNRRLMSRELTLSFSRASDSDDGFDIDENILMSFLFKTKYLLDVDKLRQVPVAVLSYDIDFDPGSYKRSSDNTITFNLLEPFWTYVLPTSINASLSIDINEIAVSSLGYIDIPGIIYLQAFVALSDLTMYIDETKEGIEILDDLFGVSTHNEMEINCIEGTLTIGAYDRINSITKGTGFFNFPFSSCNLIVIPNAVCAIKIDRYKREYI